MYIFWSFITHNHLSAFWQYTRHYNVYVQACITQTTCTLPVCRAAYEPIKHFYFKA